MVISILAAQGLIRRLPSPIFAKMKQKCNISQGFQGSRTVRKTAVNAKHISSNDACVKGQSNMVTNSEATLIVFVTPTTAECKNSKGLYVPKLINSSNVFCSFVILIATTESYAQFKTSGYALRLKDLLSPVVKKFSGIFMACLKQI